MGYMEFGSGSFLDLKNKINTVDQSILLPKLSNYGLLVKQNKNLFMICLNHEQCVIINNESHTF